MIGVFDSGTGGILALRELRRLMPREATCLYIDSANAPYGTKDEGELLRLVKLDIERLRCAGADKILMACCTASTVYDLLSDEEKSIATPIIAPAARRAVEITKRGKIGVIATERTVSSHAFKNAILKERTDVCVTELAAQELVSLVEGGAFDANITESERELLQNTLAPLCYADIDTIVLGCTHFPALSGEISKILNNVKIVSSTYEGALEISKRVARDRL